WNDNSNNETGFKIERSSDGTNFTQIATAAAGATSYSDTGLASSTTYYYRVRATNSVGDSPYSSTASAQTSAQTSSSLPNPWQQGDVGAVGVAGSASYSSGTFSIDGGGGVIWTNADAFRFIYQPINGDGTVIARVTSVENTAGWAKAGVMIRESLAANAREASVHVTP